VEKLINIEMLHWKQKAGKNWILQGDANSNFFHQFVSGRRRKNTIAILESDVGEVRGQNDITRHIVDFYKRLFGPNEPCSMSLSSNFWPDNLVLSWEESDQLVKPFSLEEIKEVVMGMKENSAPRPNGYGVVFFKKFWEVIKIDMVHMFEDLYNDQLDIKRLNYGVITLIPKLKDVNNIKQYRPIYLLNVDYKCFTKALTNRLVPVARKRIGKNQTGFIKEKHFRRGFSVT
jgi:hypothetical protein